MRYSSSTFNCLKYLGQLNVLLGAFFLSTNIYAHQSPTTLALLDVSPNVVILELHLPLSELSLALGKDLSANAQALIATNGLELKSYVLNHAEAFVDKDKPWKIFVTDVYLDESKDEVSGIVYKELKIKLLLKPNSGENTRQFTLAYDAIMHQVGNHVAYVSIRNDWELGNVRNEPAEIGIIRVDTKDNRVYPLKINLEEGSKLKGFTGMIAHGMHHIKEGTDHLLFILTLLLPACLLVNNQKWAGYGGLKNSIFKLIKIVTAFTIGHSMTLLIGAFNIFEFPVQIIEVLIAFSILITAIHAIKPLFYNKEIFIAVGFGFIHGLAFSQTLQNLHLSTNELLLSVAGFNLGIEIMQLLIVLLIIPSFFMMSQTPYFKHIKNVLAFFVALISVGWILERISNKTNLLVQSVEIGLTYNIFVIVSLYVVAIFTYLLWKSRKLKT